MSAREAAPTVSPAVAAMTRYAESTGAITDPGLKELYRIVTDLYAELNAARARVAELEAVTPAQIQTCRACGAGYTYGEPCSVCAYKQKVAEALGRDLPEVTSTEAAERAAVDRSITDQFPATAADRWNSLHPVGTPVYAYPGCRPEGDPKAEQLTTRTRSKASVLGGHTAVVWVEGHSACISLTHVDPRPEGGAR